MSGIQIKKYVFIILLSCLFLLTLIINLNIGNIVDKYIHHEYQEAVLSSDMVKAILHNFTINEDGSVTADNKESWAYIVFSDYGISNNIDRIDMYVSYASVEKKFGVYTVGSYVYTTADMREGIVSIPVDKLTKDDGGIRIDFGMEYGNTFVVDKIVVNDIKSIKKDFITRMNQISFAVFYGVFMALFVYLGRRLRNHSHIKSDNRVTKWIYDNMFDKKIILFLTSFVFGLSFLVFYTNIKGYIFLLLLPIAFLVFGFFCDNIKIYNRALFQTAYSVISIMIICVLMLFVMLDFSGSDVIWNVNSITDKNVAMFFDICIMLIGLNTVCYFDSESDRFNSSNKQFNNNFISIVLIYTLIDTAIIKRINLYNNELTMIRLKHFLDTGNIFINIIFVYLMYLIVANLLGINIGNVISILVAVIFTIGNMIKFRFQGDILTISDFNILGEAFGIAGAYVNTFQIILIVLLIAGIIFALIKFRKKVLKYLKPEFCPAIVFLIPILALLIKDIKVDKLNEKYIYKTDVNSNVDRVRATEYGLANYYLGDVFGKTDIKENQRPGDYNSKLPDRFVDVEQIKSDISEDIKPNVVLIMAESLCDINTNQTDIVFSYDPLKNMRPYIVCNVVSPSYGGRTVLSEYEALTGLSNYLIASDTVVYTTYINSNINNIGGLAREFNDNGYITKAMHPNTASYYNRDVVYEKMEFDEFLSKTDFEYTDEDFLLDGRLNDAQFFENIKLQLDADDGPQFIFGVTFGGHSPYNTKYTSTDIEAYSDSASASEIEDAKNYAQTVSDLDMALADFYDYVMQSDEPTLVYVWGDHLPSLELYNNRYIRDIEFKYTVPMIAFSNFEDIDIGENFISPSQIATQIIKDSGIKHRKYFDYIYSLRDKYPVLQKEWTQSVDEDDLSLYIDIEYDLIFGSRYLLK